MVINADPKPGRWILPLVVLGMVAFTYFFVRALPADNVDFTPTTQDPAGTTVPTTDDTDTDPTDTTTTTFPLDPTTQDYLDGVSQILSAIEELQREMAAVNGGFDANPRTVEYSDAVARLRALIDQANGLVDRINELTPPDALTTNHETIRTAVTTAAGAAEDALAGLQSTDDGTQRRNAVIAFDSAVADLQVAVENARSAAGLAAGTGEDDGDGDG